MRNQTKLVCIGAIVMISLTGIIMNAVLEDADGPLIYEVDILPVQPVAGDTISVVIYCIDRSGVSGAQLSSSLDGESWTVLDMQFFACLCIAGGRWVGTFGPVNESDNAQFFVTAFDNAPIRNAAISQTFSIQLTTM
ncbi:MAG: hypothetical protein C4K48_03370 [Candidatus Thorarchaeota archaeon]|nr:MAG: hypothetical protein C4K48_03370 [Candidatus Thorarchaeota archaeon]